MFLNLFLNENSKNFRRMMLWVELAIMALAVILIETLLYTVARYNLGQEANTPQAIEQLRQMITWPGAINQVLGFAGGNLLGGLLLVVLSGAVTAQEYNWRTAHLWLSRGTPRLAFLSGKFAGLLVAAGLIVLTALLVGGLISAIFTLQLDGALPFAVLNWGEVGLSVLRTAYTLLPYAALAFFLGVATRSVVVAIGGGLAYSLLIEGILLQMLALAGGTAGKIGAYLPSGLATSIMNLNANTVQGHITVNGQAAILPLLDPWAAAAGIALWTASFLFIAAWIFQRQDLSE